ncbi:MAG: hypothetical protein JXB46_02835 [Candidatus Eisenbacteria bacterium]|nr:hypothetical protein [Candidatus Eisenbacteria bacterium]
MPTPFQTLHKRYERERGKETREHRKPAKRTTTLKPAAVRPVEDDTTTRKEDADS